MNNSDTCSTYTVYSSPCNNTRVLPAGRRGAQPTGLEPTLYSPFWKTLVPINISGVTLELPVETCAVRHIGCSFLLHNCKQNCNALTNVSKALLNLMMNRPLAG
jgi:hypothetical protein